MESEATELASASRFADATVSKGLPAQSAQDFRHPRESVFVLVEARFIKAQYQFAQLFDHVLEKCGRVTELRLQRFEGWCRPVNEDDLVMAARVARALKQRRVSSRVT